MSTREYYLSCLEKNVDGAVDGDPVISEYGDTIYPDGTEVNTGLGETYGSVKWQDMMIAVEIAEGDNVTKLKALLKVFHMHGLTHIIKTYIILYLKLLGGTVAIIFAMKVLSEMGIL